VTLGGLRSALQDILSADGRSTPGDLDYIVSMKGALPNQLDAELPNASTETALGVTELKVYKPILASVGWDDPTDLIMAAFDEIMLRTAVAAADVEIFKNVR
jgi:hypothetical protein